MGMACKGLACWAKTRVASIDGGSGLSMSKFSRHSVAIVKA